MKPLVFISHSAKEPKYAKALDALEAELRTAGWEVFVDRTRVNPGEKWLEPIHTALAVCDAAVILFSKNAYEDSEWVLKESTIFSWRAALDREFKIVCALYPEVTQEMLSTGRYKPIDLGRYIPVFITDDGFTKQVTKAIGCAPADTPGNRIVRAIVKRLKEVDPADLHLAAAKLGKRLTWSSDVDRVQQFARDLMHASLAEVHEALQEIATYLDPEDIHEINRLLIPFAVDPVATARIPKAALGTPDGRLVFVVNAAEKTTGEHYVQRARCHPTSWPVIELANAGGHDTAGSLKREVLDAIALQRPSLGNDEKKICEMLEAQRHAGVPVFVIVHGPVDQTTVSWLRKDFPSCTFIVLAGESASERAYKAAGVELLAPPLADGREAAIDTHYRLVRGIAETREQQRK